MSKTKTINGETHWHKVSKAFMPSDTPEQKLALAAFHEKVFIGSRG
jgi:hypothetical protein